MPNVPDLNSMQAQSKTKLKKHCRSKTANEIEITSPVVGFQLTFIRSVLQTALYNITKTIEP